MVMPRPLSGCQIKAEIKGFLLVYRLFLYKHWFLPNFDPTLGVAMGVNGVYPSTGCKSPNDTFVKINIQKEPLLVQKQTIHQQRALDLSF